MKFLEAYDEMRYCLIDTIKKKILGFRKTHYREVKLSFNEDIENFIRSNENIYLEGYWQSEKYFERIKDVIKNEFVFEKFSEEKNIFASNKIYATNSVAIHVRRGDYVKNPLYSDICTLDYYKRAIKYITQHIDNPFFYIFSDDIHWCIENFNDLNQIEFIDWNNGKQSYRDMQLMSLCKHNIIANSTFSWWGAWLNKNPSKIVIAPKKILNSSNDAIDLITNSWIKK